MYTVQPNRYKTDIKFGFLHYVGLSIGVGAGARTGAIIIGSVPE
jgi:hypothetical protein